MKSINEMNYQELMRKQGDITRLHSKFPDRVDAVYDAGGVKLYEVRPNVWRFKVTSGTTRGKKYDAYINFDNLPQLLKKNAENKMLWTRDGKHLDLRKLGAEILLDTDLQLFCSCLTGDTEVMLADGSFLTLEELNEIYKGGKKFKVLTTTDSGEVVAKKAQCLGVTGWIKFLLLVTLDNGADVKCTDNHEFRLKDGSYMSADKLTAGMELMPGFIGEPVKVSSISRLTYTESQPVYDLSVEDTENYVLEAGVVVHNCPADLYWGGQYIRTRQDAKYTKPENRPPLVRNPDLHGDHCKHLQAVMERLPMYVATMATFLNKYYGKDILKYEAEVLARRPKPKGPEAKPKPKEELKSKPEQEPKKEERT